MTLWDELRPVLASLRDRRPRVLNGCPSISSEVQTPPFRIRLVPSAVDVAEELHRQFGDNVILTVGRLPYPPGSRELRRRDLGPPEDPLDPRAATTELDGPAVVRSGQTLHHHLVLHNLGSSELQVATNGGVTADVVDPQTGEVVGGYSGAQIAPLIVFRAAPRGSVRIPLRIGTASQTPRLGYAVPPGEWGIQVTVTLGRHPRDAPRRRTPILPLTITA